MGTVARGEAQGDSAWIYEVVVSADVETTAQWYLQTLAAIDWQPVGDSSAAGGTRRLQFNKGAAQQEVMLAPDGQGGTRALVSVGVGTPVLQTQ